MRPAVGLVEFCSTARQVDGEGDSATAERGDREERLPGGAE